MKIFKKIKTLNKKRKKNKRSFKKKIKSHFLKEEIKEVFKLEIKYLNWSIETIGLKTSLRQEIIISGETDSAREKNCFRGNSPNRKTTGIWRRKRRKIRNIKEKWHTTMLYFKWENSATISAEFTCCFVYQQYLALFIKSLVFFWAQKWMPGEN